MLPLTPQFKLEIALSHFSSSQANTWDGAQETKPKKPNFFPPHSSLFTGMCFHLLFCGASVDMTIFLTVTASALRNLGSFCTKVTVPRQVQNGKNNYKNQPKANKPTLLVCARVWKVNLLNHGPAFLFLKCSQHRGAPALGGREGSPTSSVHHNPRMMMGMISRRT